MHSVGKTYLWILPRCVGLAEARHDEKRTPRVFAFIRCIFEIIDRLVAKVPIVNLIIVLHAVSATLATVRAFPNTVWEVRLLVHRPVLLRIPRARILMKRLPQSKSDVPMISEVSRSRATVKLVRIDEVPHLVSIRPPACHEAHAGRRANGELAVRMLEEERLGGQRVEIWRDGRQAVCVPVGAHIVGDEVEDVLALAFARTCRAKVWELGRRWRCRRWWCRRGRRQRNGTSRWKRSGVRHDVCGIGHAAV